MTLSFEVVTQTVAICGMITGIGAVIALLIKAYNKAKEPNQLQDSRIKQLEERMKKVEESLSKGDERFESIEDGNQIMLRCMLALMAHGIDGNEIAGLKKAKADLEGYLINTHSNR